MNTGKFVAILREFKWWIIAAVTVLAYLASRGSRSNAGGRAAQSLQDALRQANDRHRAAQEASEDEKLEERRSRSLSDRVRGVLDRARRRRSGDDPGSD